jgi:bifunctional DNA-binding transcriptional regulator/antitoxin component of YhaV-PrlF toxin-antitoxin module
MLRFTGTLEEVDRGGARIDVPFDVREAFGEARPPVAATVNGAPYRSRLMVYGGITYLGLTNAIRSEVGIDPGDDVEITLERDDSPREVDLPAELAEALAGAPDLRERFDGLAFTHRREYAQWVGEAKKPETRLKRAARAVEMLGEGGKHP